MWLCHGYSREIYYVLFFITQSYVECHVPWDFSNSLFLADKNHTLKISFWKNFSTIWNPFVTFVSKPTYSFHSIPLCRIFFNSIHCVIRGVVYLKVLRKFSAKILYGFEWKKVREKKLVKKNSHVQYLFDTIAQIEWDTFSTQCAI